MAVRPVGQLVEEHCRRGTRWLSWREQHMNRVLIQYIAAAPVAGVDTPTCEHSPCEYRGASATLCDRHLSHPPHLSAAQSKECRPSGTTMRRRRLCRPTPCPRPSTADSRSRSAADAPPARPARGFALRAKLRGEPPASPSFGKSQTLQRLMDLQAKWGHGVGRHARQMRGKL